MIPRLVPQTRPCCAPPIGSALLLSRLHSQSCTIEKSFLSLGNDLQEMPSKLEQSAIHEAAHAVVATMIRRGIVQEVFISDTAVDITDEYDELNVTVHGLTGGVRFNHIQTTVFENGLIAYSGFFAECENLYRSGADLEPILPQLREQASHDIDRYKALLAKEGLTPEEIRNVEIDLGGALKHYFDSGLWEQIQILAAALMERGRLTGEEVLELLPPATGGG